MSSLSPATSSATTHALSDQARRILSDVLMVCQQGTGSVDAQSYRVDHEEWIEDILVLAQQRYLILEENTYRPSLVALTVLRSEQAKAELMQCEKLFGILRAHFKVKSTRNTNKRLSELAAELGVEFAQAVQTTNFLLDAASLWCAGRSSTLNDPGSSFVLPSEAIITIRSFQNLLGCMSQWLNPPPIALVVEPPELLSAPEVAQVGALHPGPVVTSFLYELESDAIVQIVSRTGLSISWGLMPDQQFSHKTRIRAYKPRIESALLELPKKERLLFAQNLANEILKHRPDFAAPLNDALTNMGWRIASGRLTSEDLDLREQFFPSGAEHTAYVELRRILSGATNEIYIVDPYLDSSIFTMLSAAVKDHLKIRLLGSKFPRDFLLEAAKFETEFHGVRIEARKCKDFHDRFIVLDRSTCFHIGASIKDAGGRAFMISQLEETSIVGALLNFVNEKWTTSAVL